jgi:hypothetical protein
LRGSAAWHRSKRSPPPSSHLSATKPDDGACAIFSARQVRPDLPSTDTRRKSPRRPARHGEEELELGAPQFGGGGSQHVRLLRPRRTDQWWRHGEEVGEGHDGRYFMVRRVGGSRSVSIPRSPATKSVDSVSSARSHSEREEKLTRRSTWKQPGGIQARTEGRPKAPLDRHRGRRARALPSLT